MTDQQLPPVLGGFDLSDQERFAEGFPHHVFTRLRQEAPVFFHPPGRTADGEGFWVLSRYADIKAAAADPAFSSQGGGGRAGGGTHIDDLAPGVHAGTMLNMMDDPGTGPSGTPSAPRSAQRRWPPWSRSCGPSRRTWWPRPSSAAKAT